MEESNVMFDLIKDMAIFKLLTDGEIDYEQSVKLGCPVIKNVGETWSNPKRFSYGKGFTQ